MGSRKGPLSWGKPRLLLIVIGIAIVTMSTPSASLMVAGEPSMVVHEPWDGMNLTAREVTVRGNLTAPQRVVSLGSTQLGNHSDTNMAWESGRLRMHPIRCFSDDFSGTELDASKWEIVRDTGTITVGDGVVNLRGSPFYPTRGAIGLIRSVDGLFPDDMDWTAYIKLYFTVMDEFGAGSGLTANDLEHYMSVASIGAAMEGPNEYLEVYARGSSVFTKTNNGALYSFTLKYSTSTDVYTVILNDEELKTFESQLGPERFWFGCPTNRTSGLSIMGVDSIRLWAHSGSWLSHSFDFEHEVAIEGVRPKVTSTHAGKATTSIEARISFNNASWSNWTPVLDGLLPSPTRGRYLQLRVVTSLPDVLDENAGISIGSFDLTYRDPLISVEARRVGGDWVLTEGLESWSANIELNEDVNVVEVRALDTSGVYNETRLNLTVDTTPPVGTVGILPERPYLNDPNVTLTLNATDKYGVVSVQISDSPQMRNMRVFPYTAEVPWRLKALEGTVSVYVRYVDAHGLLGEIINASVVYDALQPSGSLIINEGAAYTTSTDVRLDLEYHDNMGVVSIELSNWPDLSDALVIDPPRRSVGEWELEGDDDGPRTIHMRVTDVAGNKAVCNATIELYVPKALGSIIIEEGANITGKTIVQLLIDCPPELRADIMQLSNKGDFDGVAWEALARDVIWILEPGDGVRTVHVRFKDFRGIVTVPVNSSIIVDNTPPQLAAHLEGGAEYTTATDLSATVEYSDASPGSWMWLAADERLDLVERQAFCATFPWTVPAKEGVHHLWVKIEDMAGNTAITHTTIHFATTRPTLTLQLPEGAISNSTSIIEVIVTVSDPYGDVEVQVAFGTPPSDSDPWLSVEEMLHVHLPPGVQDGSYEVIGRARNVAGLISEIVMTPVVLDRTPPSLSIEEPHNGSTLTQEEPIVKLRFEVQRQGTVSVRYRVDGGEWMPIAVGDEEVVLEMAEFGEHTVDMRAVDNAGNTATTSSTFVLEWSGDPGASGWMLPIIFLVVIVLLGLGVLYNNRGTGTGE